MIQFLFGFVFYMLEVKYEVHYDDKVQSFNKLVVCAPTALKSLWRVYSVRKYSGNKPVAVNDIKLGCARNCDLHWALFKNPVFRKYLIFWTESWNKYTLGIKRIAESAPLRTK